MANALTAVAKSSFEKLFEGNAKIVSVRVADDTDSDGDPILLVRVVFESDSGKLDAGRAVVASRTLRDALLARGEERFPLLSFVAKSDADEFEAA